MNLISSKYFEDYIIEVVPNLEQLLLHFDYTNKQIDSKYLTQASAVYSSNIEGNSIDLNSFMNFKLNKQISSNKKEINEIEDLIKAYEFAQLNELTESNFLQAHKLLSKSILINSFRGKYRNDKVGVFGDSGLIYLAIESELLEETMKAFFVEINQLLESKLSIVESFYYASFIHLKFVHIHPFRDGNGRAARLLEKWFLSQSINNSIWKISSEKYYKQNQQAYYNNINIGVNYYELNYDKSLPFLLMLPQSVKL